MKPALASTVPLALAACFALTGCTIYTYESPPPGSGGKRPAKTKPAATTAAPAKPGIIKNPAGSGGTVTPSTDTPTVKGKTIFGGGAVQPFAGEAFVIPDGSTKLPNFNDLIPFARLYTDQFQIAPQTFSGGFPGALLQEEWFAIRYQGRFAVPTTDRYTFKLVSDDGAALYINNQKIIDNDGVHTAKTATAETSLNAGTHTLRLEYFQEKKGTVALQLFMVVGGKDVPVTGIP
jgi:hypothetical protein